MSLTSPFRRRLFNEINTGETVTSLQPITVDGKGFGEGFAMGVYGSP